MMLVRIVRDYTQLPIFRQTPGESGLWQGITFTEDPEASPDFIVILNRNHENILTTLPRERIWSISHEPPAPGYRHFHQLYRRVGRAITPDTSFRGPQVEYSHGAIPWHCQRSYDFFKSLAEPIAKTRELSCITSSKVNTEGTRKRLAFVQDLQQRLPLDLFGRGLQLIDDKFLAHRDYHFSIVMENCSDEYYWSEKIMDCLLAWSFPFYWGCPMIGDFLPAGSFLAIDIEKPAETETAIRAKLAEGVTAQNFQAMDEARQRILDGHQLFPFLAKRLKEADPNLPHAPVRPWRLPATRAPSDTDFTWSQRMGNRIAKARISAGAFLGKLRRRNNASPPTL